jgi:hypothetical protein
MAKSSNGEVHMKRVSAIIVLASLMFSAMGCVVHTRPEYVRRHHHHHPEHREVVVVHEY